MSSPRSHSKFRAGLDLKLSSRDFRSECFLCLGTDSSGALEDVHIHPFTSPVPHVHLRGLNVLATSGCSCLMIILTLPLASYVILGTLGYITSSCRSFLI